ncbi:MAG: transcriptional regulator [Cycloclasticus sp. symbiont of Bathymodiolus heckerae]|nr:MAG: transcriptional regulator [Cycloclasticus sp. symbiont of Bathymodiolus heckerae]
MANKTPDELHNELMDYPCEFTIKTMGYAHIELDLIVVDIVRRHAPDISENAVQSKFSKSKKYISLSVTITAQSKQQMDAIYQDLFNCEHVLMSL